MKKRSFYTIILMFIFLIAAGSLKADQVANSQSPQKLNPDFNVECSGDLLPLTQSWVNEFSKANPEANIGIVTGQDQVSPNDLRFINAGELNSAGGDKKWHMVIGKKVIIPVMNINHPMNDIFNRDGISTEILKQMVTSGESQVHISGRTSPIKFYLPNDPEVLVMLSRYLACNTSDLKAIMVNSQDELIASLQADASAIGFCSADKIINENYDALQGKIAILPLDKNSNGRLDSFEKIYSDADSFMRGVWIGKYPKKLTEPIYAVSENNPSNAQVALLGWILKDGQSFMQNMGFGLLTATEANTGVQMLTGAPVKAENITSAENASIWPFIILALVIAGLLITGIIKYIIWNRKSVKTANIQFAMGLNENGIEAPKGMFFDKSHTWAYLELDGNVKVGVDDFLQHLTGPLTKVKLKEAGETVRKGEKFLTIIRNGKQLNLCSPVTGVIKEQNNSLESNTRLINISPYKEGWVYKIEPKNWLREIDFLIPGSKCKEWLNTEFNRLKDFFAETVNCNNSAYAHIVLQDGGELTDNVLAELDPKVWEDFQSSFIDVSK